MPWSMSQEIAKIKMRRGIRNEGEKEFLCDYLTIVRGRQVLFLSFSWVMTQEEDMLRARVCSAVARLLREERERLFLSMSEVAGRAGISQQMVSYVERELRTPTIDTLFRLAQALGLNPITLLTKAAAPELGLRSRYRRKG